MKLLDVLLRNGNTVDKERAERIEKGVRKHYQRKIQDIKEKRSDLMDKVAASLDLKGEDANSMVNPKNFDAQMFVAIDLEDTLNLKQFDLDIATAEKRYLELFEEEVPEI